MLSMVIAACGWSWSMVDISQATLFENGLTLELGVDACTSDHAVEVEESQTTVLIEVSANEMAGDCGLGTIVTLESPLGDREVVDKFDNLTVPVTRP